MKQFHEKTYSHSHAGWLKSTLAQVLAFTLFISAVPVVARAEWRQQPLPGTLSGAKEAAVIAGGGVAAGLLVYVLVKRKRAHDARPITPVNRDSAQTPKPFEPSLQTVNDAVKSRAGTAAALDSDQLHPVPLTAVAP